MTTFQEKNLPSGRGKICRILHAAGHAGSGIFSDKNSLELRSGKHCIAEGFEEKILHPYFSAITIFCEENHLQPSCTFVTRQGSIRFADSNRALADNNTQPEAGTDTTRIQNPISKQGEL